MRKRCPGWKRRRLVTCSWQTSSSQQDTSSQRTSQPRPTRSLRGKEISLSKFTSKAEFLTEIDKERANLQDLLDSIPEDRKTEEVVDGMSVKDFLAHRTEWGRMMLRWYSVAKDGGTPAVPSEKWKWNQLKELNAEIKEAYTEVSLSDIEEQFGEVHDELRVVIDGMTEEELFTKKYYSFTGSSDLVTYANSASAAHYRSARRHINKWWKAQSA